MTTKFALYNVSIKKCLWQDKEKNVNGNWLVVQSFRLVDKGPEDRYLKPSLNWYCLSIVYKFRYCVSSFTLSFSPLARVTCRIFGQIYTVIQAKVPLQQLYLHVSWACQQCFSTFRHAAQMHGKASPRLPSAPLMSVAPKSDGFSQLNPTRSVFRKSTNKTITSSENYKNWTKKANLVQKPGKIWHSPYHCDKITSRCSCFKCV